MTALQTPEAVFTDTPEGQAVNEGAVFTVTGTLPVMVEVQLVVAFVAWTVYVPAPV